MGLETHFEPDIEDKLDRRTTYYMFRGPGFDRWAQRGGVGNIGTANQEALERDAEKFIEDSNESNFGLKPLGYNFDAEAWQFSGNEHGIFHLTMLFQTNDYKVDVEEDDDSGKTYYIGPNPKKSLDSSYRDRAFFIIKERNPVRKGQIKKEDRAAFFGTSEQFPIYEEPDDTEQSHGDVWETPADTDRS